MSGFGNFLAGAVGGGGAAVAGLASRYIDEEIAQNRAQALADIQHQNMVRGEEYMQSAPVQERRLGNERNLLKMRNHEGLAGKVAEASSPELRQAKIDDRVSFLRGTTPAEVDAQNAVIEGTAGAKLDAERMRAKVMTPLEVERAAGIADAQWGARSAYDERLDKSASGTGKAAKMSEAGKLQLQDINKQDEALQKAINDGVAGGTLKQDPKDPAWQHFTRQKQALQVQKMRVFAREGLISGAEDAASVIASGATPQELEASMKQAQLIGSDYANEFNAAVKDHLSKRTPASAAPAPAQKPAPAPSGNIMEQRRAERQPAPPGSPQAKWDARQAELRAAAESRQSERQARIDRERSTFDADVQSMDPLELVRKYSDPSSRSSLDTSRLARLNKIERSL